MLVLVSRNLLSKNSIGRVVRPAIIYSVCHINKTECASTSHRSLMSRSTNYCIQNKTCLSGLVAKPWYQVWCRGFRRRQPIIYTATPKFDYSGDLDKLPPIDSKAYVYKFQGITKELENAPEAVKKLASLEFANRLDRKEHRKYETFRNMENKLDGETEKERQIAQWTTEIRNHMAHCMVYRGDKVSKAKLIEKIAKRKKHLKFLRKLDFERFHWLLYELKIRYTNFPLYYRKQTKRFLRKQEVRQKAMAAWKVKMDKLKKSVEAEKEQFYSEKSQILEGITEDLRQLNIDEKEVFEDFVKSLEPPKRVAVNRNYQRILRNYQAALDAGDITPKKQMSPIR